ncbi:TBCC domain-containing protein 1 [Megalops cyprinoides]|uniref:TBCC domain-containing protein 1 n=1 Tax=Megalops cyprinoides TaxID=118141 RepID=UPI001864503A|nr:TBCC domain-containing protein 1 [Megalops cyprinoides]XP_036401355.1 TBCC domain-containing protein 1 [Megalops cyprinoides]
MDQGKASVWARLEPFLLGALQAAPPAKLSMHYLRKMAAYVHTREGCYPRLGWPMWRHIACGKLQLPEDLAWLYFETFDLLMPHAPEDRLGWAEALSQCHSTKELDRVRSKLSVDTLQFLLFLYMQQLNRVSLRTSLIGEEWPSPRARSPSPSSDREAKTSSQNKNWDDQAHLTFVQTHLSDLLELLVEPGQLSQLGQVVRDSQVSMEAVQGLSFLLEGSVSRGRTVHPLHRLLSRAPLQAQAGYSKISRSFSLQQLQTWLRQALDLNPFGVSACLRSGKKLAWAQQVEGSIKRAKIARNTHMAPPGSKVMLVSQVFRQTLAKDSDKLAGANVKLHRCSEAFIYLLCPLRSVSLDKCRNSTVVLGPVETSVYVQSCENVRVVCVAGRLAVGASSHCTLHVLTPTRPLLLPGNVALTLGPFHTHYPSLEDHMASVGLAVVPNVWDQPLVIGAEGTPAADSPPYRLLPPAEFCSLVIPFHTEGDTCEVPGGLPPLYKEALDARESRVQDWQKMVKDARLTKEQRRQFQALVEQKFHEWLLESGNRQQLDSLIPPAVTVSAEDTSGSWVDAYSPKRRSSEANREGPREPAGQAPTAC